MLYTITVSRTGRGDDKSDIGEAYGILGLEKAKLYLDFTLSQNVIEQENLIIIASTSSK